MFTFAMTFALAESLNVLQGSLLFMERRSHEFDMTREKTHATVAANTTAKSRDRTGRCKA